MNELIHKKNGVRLINSDDLRIFPLSKMSKGKPLEAKDYVEIAIRYCLMDDSQIFSLVYNIILKNTTPTCMNVFPLYLYKLFVYYEKMGLFEELYDRERRIINRSWNDVVQTCFSYAIVINNLNIALYILQKYKRSFTEKVDKILDEILHIINEAVSNKGNDITYQRFINLEQLLYFLSLFTDRFTPIQITFFANI